jgi:fructokinase
MPVQCGGVASVPVATGVGMRHIATMDYALVEGGGTKFVLGVAGPEGTIRARERLPTRTPEETLGRAIAWFSGQAPSFAAVGIACFGPLQLDPAAPDWGHVLRAVKPFWSGADVVGPFAQAFGCPVGIETDVNGAALAESQLGAGRGRGSLLYVTVGTGIGAGFVSQGRLLRGAAHPEMGHIPMGRHPDDRDFAGVCPVHGDCLEGLACGPAVEARWGSNLSELPAEHPGHAMIAWYLGQAVATWQGVLQPERIVLGGGVSAAPGLLDRIRAAAREAGGGFFAGDPADIVVPPALGTDSGLLGALAVARQAEQRQS